MAATAAFSCASEMSSSRTGRIQAGSTTLDRGSFLAKNVTKANDEKTTVFRPFMSTNWPDTYCRITASTASLAGEAAIRSECLAAVRMRATSSNAQGADRSNSRCQTSSTVFLVDPKMTSRIIKTTAEHFPFSPSITCSRNRSTCTPRSAINWSLAGVKEDLKISFRHSPMVRDETDDDLRYSPSTESGTTTIGELVISSSDFI